MHRVCILAAVLLSLVLASPPIRGQQPSDADFSPQGLQPKQSYFAQFPFERVDMVNGNLLLTFTDLVLPGNAGMDLRVQRTYNKQGPGWRFGLAGVPMEVDNPEAPWPEGDPSRIRPSLRTADGTAHGTMPLNGLEATDVWVTQQFWRYTLATRTVDLPNGWTATYSNDPGRALLQEVHDPFGNQISVAWDAYDPQDLTTRRPLAFTQTVGDDTREVSFTYETSWSLMPKTMLFGGRTWTFNYASDDPFRLESVASPAGPAWQFDYSSGLKLTTPAGGTVHYTFEDQTFPDDGVPRAVVRTRATGGRAVSGGNVDIYVHATDPNPRRQRWCRRDCIGSDAGIQA